jgi:hypothetical protein
MIISVGRTGWVKRKSYSIAILRQHISSYRPVQKEAPKSLSVKFYLGIASEGILEVLPNFLFLEELSVNIESISSHELTSVLQSLPQITTFGLHIRKFQDTPMGRKLCLTVRGTRARNVWTTKLGGRIKHLSLYIEGTLPPISCKGLKCLALEGSRDQSRELFEPSPCDLSYLTHLAIYHFSTEQQL